MAGMKTPTPAEVLALPLAANDAGAATVRDYLVSLLALVWRDGECFDGKRPFGNSSWEYELYLPIVAAGMVDGEVHVDGCLVKVDQRAADELIADAIQALGAVPDGV
jgi:hypothetical protein